MDLLLLSQVFSSREAIVSMQKDMVSTTNNLDILMSVQIGLSLNTEIVIRLCPREDDLISRNDG